MKRKKFLYNLAFLTMGFGLHPQMLGSIADSSIPVTILHTNDTLGHVRPLPPNAGPHAGQGGMARRASVVKKVRQNQKPVILADAGNVMGDTVFSNFYDGAILYRMMNDMGYDVSCIGRNDLKRGIPVFLDAAEEAGFPFVLSNFNIRHDRMNKLVKSHIVIEKEGLRIGFFGLGRNLQSCGMPPDVSSVFEFRNPLLVAGANARKLKYTYSCHLVIGLSRLGFPEKNKKNQITDWDICREVQEVDMIIGGPNRRFMNQAYRYERKNQPDILVSQAGYGGAMIGKTVFTFKQIQKGGMLQNIFSSNRQIE